MQIIQEHIRAYPLLCPTDVLKLLYQRAFGGEHIALDEKKAAAYLAAEYETVPQTADFPKMEKIGGSVMRVYLDGIPKTSVGTFARLFVRGARGFCADANRLKSDIVAVCAAAKRGEMPFPAAKWDAAVAQWQAAGMPPVRHSEEYRAAYRPAYRLLPSRFVPYLPLIFAIDSTLAQKEYVTLAIDGMCGSGKSTLAALLSDLYGAAVVRMDDFFLPPSLRTPSRLAEVGGNIHYERFAQEVSPHLGWKAFSYRAFDCGKMALGDTCAVPHVPLTVVEGSYALHPSLYAEFDLTAYVFCSPEEQLSRLRARCASEALFARFVNDWIPMEDAYARAFGVQEQADFCIDTTEMAPMEAI